MTDVVKVKASHEGDWIGVRGRLQTLLVEPVQNEVVDPVCRPPRNPGRRNRMLLRGLIGPWLGVGTPLRDPLS